MIPTGDGQAFMLDQRFFHESVKGGFFIGIHNIFIFFKLGVFLHVSVRKKKIWNWGEIFKDLLGSGQRIYISKHSWAQRKLSSLSPLSPLNILLSINCPLISLGFNGLND